jgi:uncharacterized protein (TIGR00369 family)
MRGEKGMTFSLVDRLLSRQIAGEVRSPAAEHLGLRLVRFARGVAVCEMPLRSHACDPFGRVENGVLTALAETAMTAAARSIVADGHASPRRLATRNLAALFHRDVWLDEASSLRAEAIVVRRSDAEVRVEAEVLCNGGRVASFSASCEPAEAPAAWEAVA